MIKNKIVIHYYALVFKFGIIKVGWEYISQNTMSFCNLLFVMWTFVEYLLSKM
jgi:hypothetical protein